MIMSLNPMPVGATFPEGKPVIGRPGEKDQDTPGVRTDATGTRARSIAPKKKAPKRGVSDLGEKREIRIMRGHKVPMPRIGDRRALIAPGRKSKGRPLPSELHTFAVVEYAGTVCVKVHGATDDYREVQNVARATAIAVQVFMRRGALGIARQNGNVLGKELPAVRVVDRSGLAERVPRKKAGPKGPNLVRDGAKVYRSAVRTAEEQVQFDHQRDITRVGSCAACDGKIKNVPCGAAGDSEAVKALRAELADMARAERAKANADAMTAALQAAMPTE